MLFLAFTQILNENGKEKPALEDGSKRQLGPDISRDCCAFSKDPSNYQQPDIRAVISGDSGRRTGPRCAAGPAEEFFSLRLDLMTFKVFSNVSSSVIL